MKFIKQFLINYSGYGYLKWKFSKNGLYCFNYHRIGDSKETSYDPNVFSCSRDMFEKHLVFYKNNFKVISLEMLIELIHKKEPLTERYALITFDDGYVDNYELAFPVLMKHNLVATFFISTDYINNKKLPWWDEVAWIIKTSNLNSINLPFSRSEIIIDRYNIEDSLYNVLSEIKRNKQYRLDDVIQSLRDQSRINGGKIDIDIFMNWEMLAEMVSSGMDIGAHGISHRVLSSMSMEEQVQEVTGVKNIIEDRLKIDINAFAYPEGGSGSYNQDSLEVLKNAGYKLTFNFVSGVNTDLKKNIYELNRFSVNKNLSVSDLKLLVSLD